MKMGKHSEWRKLAKKARRKRIRQEYALINQNEVEEERLKRENSHTYKIWLEEQKEIEEFQQREEDRLRIEEEQNYLDRETVAQKQWEELQKKLFFAREERSKQNAKIKEEWEREQKRLKKLNEEKELLIEKTRKQQERLQERIEEFIGNNADMPNELHELLETNPGKQVCPFFKKTAACRFNDSCSRNHIRPTISCVLLFRNFYSHYSLEKSTENEHGTDSSLEFETTETYNHFKEFFADILPEMEKYGHLRQLKVCCNRENHLRGNVYVEYSNLREAIKSYRVFQGRWYGGKQLNAEFCDIESWKSAICGLFFRQRCPKGSVCNFLHVFRNPGHMFSSADKDLQRTPSANDFESDCMNSRNWRWSESPERENYKSRHSGNSRHNDKRNGSCYSKRSRHDSSRRSDRSSRDSSSNSSRRSSSIRSDKSKSTERSMKSKYNHKNSPKSKNRTSSKSTKGSKISKNSYDNQIKYKDTASSYSISPKNNDCDSPKSNDNVSLVDSPDYKTEHKSKHRSVHTKNNNHSKKSISNSIDIIEISKKRKKVREKSSDEI